MLMNIQSLGYDFIQGPMGVWNFACFGATAGVLFISIRDKNKACARPRSAPSPPACSVACPSRACTASTCATS